MEYFQAKLLHYTIDHQNQFHTLSHIISPELYTLKRISIPPSPIYLQRNTRSYNRIRNFPSIPLYNRVVFKSIVQEQREAKGMEFPSSRGGQKNRRPKIGFETDTSNGGKTEQLDHPPYILAHSPPLKSFSIKGWPKDRFVVISSTNSRY